MQIDSISYNIFHVVIQKDERNKRMGFFQQQAPSLSFGVFFEGLNSLAALLPAEVPVSQLGATVFACPRNCTHKKSPFYFILRQLLALQVVYFDSHCSVGHLAAKPGDTKG